MKRILITLVLFFCAINTALATGYDFGNGIQIRSEAMYPWVGTQSLGQRLIAVRNKNVYVVSGNVNIMFSKSTDGGKTYKAPILIGPWMSSPSIALSPSGTIYVVFNYGGGGVAITKSTDDGESFSSPVSTGDGHDSIVTVDDNEDVYIASDGPREQGLYKSTDGGATFINLNIPFVYYGWSPTITAKNGILFVTWGSVYFSYSTDGGQSFTNPVRVSNSGGSIALAIDNSLNIYMAWVDSGGNLYLARSKDKGTTYVVNNIAKSAGRPSLVVDAVGNVYLSWHQLSQGRTVTDVYFMYSETSGDTFAAPIKVSQGNPNWGNSPSIAVNNAQDVLIVYTSKEGVYASKSTHCTE